MSDLIIPTIHMNGTSRESLVTGYLKAADSLRDSLQALMDASPNGRDYYMQGNEAFSEARTQHLLRIDAVKTALDEITKIVEAIIE